LTRNQMHRANRRAGLGAVTGALLAACHSRDNAGPQTDPGGKEKNSANRKRLERYLTAITRKWYARITALFVDLPRYSVTLNRRY
jgi:hypothetical protein